MSDWFRIAKSDILLLMTDFQNKCNTTEIYDECDTKSWKELYEANAWEIKIEKMSIEEYIDIFTYSDGADIASASFDRCVCFNSGDRCFGSYLQDNYYKLVEMSQSFDEKVFTKDVSFATVKIDACGVPNAISYATKDYVDTVANNIEFNGDVVINGSLTVKEKGDTNMNKLGLDFGSCKNDNIKLSPYGIAVKNLKIGTWVSYDVKTKKVINVNDFVFNGSYLYKMPVALKDIKAGDVVQATNNQQTATLNISSMSSLTLKSCVTKFLNGKTLHSNKRNTFIIWVKQLNADATSSLTRTSSITSQCARLTRLSLILTMETARLKNSKTS